MIRVSLNELAVRVSRALQGIGLPVGIADDAAAIAAWHDVAGLDGIGQLRAAIPRLRAASATSPDLTVNARGTHVHATGESLLTLAGLMVDLRELGHAGGETPLILADLCDVGVIGGVAALAADRGLAAAFRADTEDATYYAVSHGTGVRWASGPRAKPSGGIPNEVQCWAVGQLSVWPPAGAGHVLDPDDLAEHLHTALAQGVPVDADAWNAIYDLAKRVLVDDGGA